MKAYGYSLYVVNYLSLVIGLNTINGQGAESSHPHCLCSPGWVVMGLQLKALRRVMFCSGEQP